jgi:hypothetical protein
VYRRWYNFLVPFFCQFRRGFARVTLRNGDLSIWLDFATFPQCFCNVYAAPEHNPAHLHKHCSLGETCRSKKPQWVKDNRMTSPKWKEPCSPARSICGQTLCERSQVAAKHTSNPAHFLQGRVPFAPLHPAHIAAVDFRLEGKTLLRQPFCLAGRSDSLSERLERSVFFQHLPVLADEDLSSTDYNPHFVLAPKPETCQMTLNENETPKGIFYIVNRACPSRHVCPWPSPEIRRAVTSMKTEYLYRRRGNPERVMAEIKRALLRKILARLKKERTEPNLLKESAPMGRI